MFIKNKDAVLRLKATIDSVDSDINSENYDDVRQNHPELTGLLQTLLAEFDDAIDSAEDGDIVEAIQLAKIVLANSENQMAISNLIVFLEKHKLRVDSEDVRKLKIYKQYTNRVEEHTSSILASLQSLD